MTDTNIYTYPIKPFQHRIVQEIQTLKPTIYNYVINQKTDHPNLTLPQLKRSIYRSVRLFIQDYLGSQYQKGIEDQYIKYYCFFETSKEFYLSQNDINSMETDIPMGLHFHLFISPLSTSIPITNLTHYLYTELTSFPSKKTSINDFGFRTYQTLPLNFILYHTKQYKDYPRDFIFKNF
jgi:hypothetical protein